MIILAGFQPAFTSTMSGIGNWKLGHTQVPVGNSPTGMDHSGTVLEGREYVMYSTAEEQELMINQDVCSYCIAGPKAK